MAEADAKWAAMPGTPPDGWSFIPAAELQADYRATMKARSDLWRADGMTWARFTDTTDGPGPPGVWLEVWKTRPEKEAAFDPPLTADPLP